MGPRAATHSGRALCFCRPPLYRLPLLPFLSPSRPRALPRTLTQLPPLFAGISSAATPPPLSGVEHQPLAKGTQLNSVLGKSYVIDEVLSRRRDSDRLLCVYRASHEGKLFILKDIFPGHFEYNISLQEHVKHSPHVRTTVDSIPDRYILVFPHLEKDLHHIKTAALSPAAKKGIIRDSLVGLANLHDKHIIHSDIKPTNIMMDSFKQVNGELGFRNVQITDLEAALVLPPEAIGVTDRLSGNCFWRSPEAWARGAQNTPSDIYSFGIVAIFTWTGRMVFCSDEATRASSEARAQLILRLHLSYFAREMEDFEGFINYHSGHRDPFVERLKALLCTFNEENPRLPFSGWQHIDSQLRDLVCRMTCMDPLRRITAREALQHPWFAED
ncbi:kinase-like domain-containing protein, partial [Chaetomium fimeti]